MNQIDEAAVIEPSESALGQENWCIDSGAISHMCNNKLYFKILEPLVNEIVKLATKQTTKGIGTVCVNTGRFVLRL